MIEETANIPIQVESNIPQPRRRYTPRHRTHSELLRLALRVKRISITVFSIPSESTDGRTWFVDFENHTCRDQDGIGCMPMYYGRTCKHYQAVEIVIQLLSNWQIPGTDVI